MTSSVPWSVKGIDPGTREAAKELARRSGMTVGEYLKSVISRDGPVAELGPSLVGDDVTGAIERLSRRIEAAEQRSTSAIGGIDQSVREALARLASTEQGQAALARRVEAVEHEAPAGRRLLDEAAPGAPSPGEAMRALETSLGKIAAQLYEGDDRTRAALDAIGERLDRAEGETTGAVRRLESAFASLDDRLREGETGALAQGERLEALATDLSARVEAARADMAETLERAAESQTERMDQVVERLTGRVEAAERRSHLAIEKLGHEVLRVAETIGRRMSDVENRSADAVEQVGGEVARIADALEARLRASDIAHAGALERLGSDIAKISDRLTDRIAVAERRSAQAIEEVGDQVVRATDKLASRHERDADDLTNRIRASEERAARFLDEARERIDARLAEQERKLAVAAGLGGYDHNFAAAGAGSAPADPFSPFQEAGGPTRARVEPPLTLATAPLATPAAPSTFEQVVQAPPPPAPALTPGPEPTKIATAPLVSAPPTESEPEPAFEPLDEFDDLVAFQREPVRPTPDKPVLPVMTDPAPLSTRDVLERARAAARSNAAAGSSASRPVSAGSAAKPGLFAGLRIPGVGKSAARRNSTLRTALVASATAAALSTLFAGYAIYGEQGGERRERTPALERASVSQEAAVPGDVAPPRLSSLTLDPAGAPTAAPEAAAPASDEGRVLYVDAAARLRAGDGTAVADIRRAAELGHAPAQLHLATLYEGGLSGLSKDPAQARRWTASAAKNGDRRAMHNLGLLYFEGQGGPKDTATAARWFRRAAELGLSDSQYNLGLINEQGIGVVRNPAEAYKWYLIAARGGDGEARRAAERIEPALTDGAKTLSERTAMAFRAAAPGGVAAVSTIPSNDVATAQRALKQLGYYRGPTDGRASPALRDAVSAWQRAAGAQPDGVIDAEVVAGLTAAG